MQVNILNGIFTDQNADFRASYPVNLVPVAQKNGISAGYLRPAEGIVLFGAGPGTDRGGIRWNDVCYRVMGTKLVSIMPDGSTTVLGDVGGGEQVTMDYSFDRLAIASGGNLFYWDGSTLQQVTDPNLKTVLTVQWVDGYFMTTDGTSLVVTELNDPFAVNPLSYGSSEADPDPIKAILKIRTEIYAINRNTIEAFENVGSVNGLFPFQRILGAQITKGSVGTGACCVFENTIAFVGNGRRESPSVYAGVNGETTKLSTTGIDMLLAEYSESELAASTLEERTEKGRSLLYLHLPDRTLVYDVNASKALGEPAWHVLTSSLTDFSQYRARNFVNCYDKWMSGDPTSSKHGFFDATLSSHYGDDVRWEFNTNIMYNEGRSAIMHEMELMCAAGRAPFGIDPQIRTSYSTDGEVWSADRFVKVGKAGERNKRITWLQQGLLNKWRIQRFQGDSQAQLTIARLEARVEALNV